jgi:tetratricopeptide (TPR) repeat protein
MDKTKLIELIRKIDREEQALYESLSEAERSLPGRADKWSPKDALAHMAAWKEREAANLAAIARGEPATKYDDFEAVNAREFETFRETPWTEIMEKAAEANRRLIAQIEGRSDADLDGPRDEKRTVWRSVAGTGYVHPVMHLSRIYAESGDRERADRLQMQAASDLLELGGGSEWEGTVKYNLACHYALSGETEKAIRGLKEALELNPGLTDWSKEDPDFAAIREAPEYIALYAE